MREKPKIKSPFETVNRSGDPLKVAIAGVARSDGSAESWRVLYAKHADGATRRTLQVERERAEFLADMGYARGR